MAIAVRSFSDENGSALDRQDEGSFDGEPIRPDRFAKISFWEVSLPTPIMLQQEARANARLAMMMAIGSLQKLAGPDQWILDPGSKRMNIRSIPDRTVPATPAAP